MVITSEILIDSLIEESEKIKIAVKSDFMGLNFDSLNFRREKYEWSPAECFDHLITTNNQYIPLIESVLEGSSSSNGNSEFRTTFSGRFLLNSVKPDNLKKNKAPRLFKPEIKLYTKEVIRSFLEQHNIITALICRSQNKDLGALKLHSPVTKLLRFNLGESFQIILQHDWRHIGQARRILNM